VITVPAFSFAALATSVCTSIVSHAATTLDSSFPSVTAFSLTIGFFAIVFSAESTVESETEVEPTVRALAESDEQAANRNARTARTATIRRPVRARPLRRRPIDEAFEGDGRCGRV
jgi:hypothetical protein